MASASVLTAMLALVVSSSSSSSSKGAEEKPKLVVLDLTVAGGVEPSVAGALTEAITNQVSATGFFQVVSAKDIQTLLGIERQKQMVGCTSEGSCLTELAGAL